mgnify:CR=1 FL=1
MKQHLEVAQKNIAGLEHRRQKASATTNIVGPPTSKVQRLTDEVEAQTTMVAKEKKAADIAEMEIGHLWDELWQSSNRENDIRAMARKSIKELKEKLDTETLAHKQTVEAFTKRIEAQAQAKVKIQELCKASKKLHRWYNEQIDNECQLSKDIQEGLHKEMARFEGLHKQKPKL